MYKVVYKVLFYGVIPIQYTSTNYNYIVNEATKKAEAWSHYYAQPPLIYFCVFVLCIQLNSNDLRNQQ